MMLETKPAHIKGAIKFVFSENVLEDKSLELRIVLVSELSDDTKIITTLLTAATIATVLNKSINFQYLFAYIPIKKK